MEIFLVVHGFHKYFEHFSSQPFLIIMALNPKFSFSEGQIKLPFDGWKLAYVIQAVLHSSLQSAWVLLLFSDYS